MAQWSPKKEKIIYLVKAGINTRLRMHKNTPEIQMENREVAEVFSLSEHYPNQKSSFRDLNNKI